MPDGPQGPPQLPATIWPATTGWIPPGHRACVQGRDVGGMIYLGKSPVEGPRAIRFLGVAGDAQADLTVHGGPEKAIHHYPRDHYEWWADRLANASSASVSEE